MRRELNKKKLKIDGRRLKIGIAVSEFNLDITEGLLEGALEVFRGAGVGEKNIKIVRVPGSFEIPFACELLAATKKFDAIAALGCIIKGETEHDRYIAVAASLGIMEVSLRNAIPVAFGILTTNDLAQAKVRSRGRHNKGKEAAEAALKMTALKNKLNRLD